MTTEQIRQMACSLTNVKYTPKGCEFPTRVLVFELRRMYGVNDFEDFRRIVRAVLQYVKETKGIEI